MPIAVPGHMSILCDKLQELHSIQAKQEAMISRPTTSRISLQQTCQGDESDPVIPISEGLASPS